MAIDKVAVSQLSSKTDQEPSCCSSRCVVPWKDEEKERSDCVSLCGTPW